MAEASTKTLLSFPQEILENIFSYLSYDEISKCRLVCTEVDKLCQGQLNQGFVRVDKFHAVIQREVKAQLPRRESERRNHPLARHVDILAAIETRLSLLSMTYMKYISMGACCFIPGKVLDEMYQVLRNIRTCSSPPRSHELLQELRDISSMAMEHFDEKIVPGIKAKMPPVQLALNSSFPGTSAAAVAGHAAASFSPLAVPGSSGLSISLSTSPARSASSLPVRQPLIRQEIYQLRQNLRSSATSVLSLKKELRDCKTRLANHERKSLEYSRKLVRQEKTLTEQARKISEQDRLINDLNRKIVEYDQKFVDVLSEISRVRSVKGDGDSGSVDDNGNPMGMSSGTSDSISSGVAGKTIGIGRGRKRKCSQEAVGSSLPSEESMLKRPKRNTRALKK